MKNNVLIFHKKSTLKRKINGPLMKTKNYLKKFRNMAWIGKLFLRVFNQT